MNKKRARFNKICKDIKSLKIQGATNVAKKGLEAYLLFPTRASEKKILSLRSTEPMLAHFIQKSSSLSKEQIFKHLEDTQKVLNKEVIKLIPNNGVVYTHCHSTAVVKALINAKKKGKKFEVYNTETRPRLQGRKTATELSRAKIKVTMFVDSAMDIALSKEGGTKKADVIFIGADALTKKGIINKIGSGMLAKIAKIEKVPLYIVADSWKFSKKKVKIEERDYHEIWEKILFRKRLKIRNPAFGFIKKRYIKGIISEYGLLKYNQFLRKVKKINQ